MTCQKRKLKTLMNIFKPVKYCCFFLSFTIGKKILQCQIILQNPLLYSYSQWNYFQRGCMDKWRSGTNLVYTFRSFRMSIISDTILCSTPHNIISHHIISRHIMSYHMIKTISLCLSDKRYDYLC